MHDYLTYHALMGIATVLAAVKGPALRCRRCFCSGKAPKVQGEIGKNRQDGLAAWLHGYLANVTAPSFSPQAGQAADGGSCQLSALQSPLNGTASRMIHSFPGAETEALFHGRAVPRFRNIERVARRRLLQLHAATLLEMLKVPPGNQLEALARDGKGQHSIRINDQWRICFVWRVDGAHQVEIVDDH